jgi:hypothetical protein
MGQVILVIAVLMVCTGYLINILVLFLVVLNIMSLVYFVFLVSRLVRVVKVHQLLANLALIIIISMEVNVYLNVQVILTLMSIPAFLVTFPVLHVNIIARHVLLVLLVNILMATPA